MKKFYTISFCLFFVGIQNFGFGAAVSTFDPVHNPALWDSLLLKYVREDAVIDGITLNVVNYTGFATDKDFPIWLQAISDANVSLATLNKVELYSFLSNVYNSFAINQILQHPCKEDLFGSCGPISGIRDIGSIVPYEAVWDKPAGTLAGKVWSLQDVENYLLSPPGTMRPDPRVHSAIVCASVSCPNLRRGAYNYIDLEKQFNESFNNRLANNKKGMSVDTVNNQVTLSMIFSWYSDMFANYFTDGKGSAVRFIITYLNRNVTYYDWLSAHQTTVSVDYFTYDWNANVDGNIPCNSGSRPCYPLWALLVTIGGVVIVLIIVVAVVVVRKRKSKNHSYHRINTD